jgi:hypothetical protein
MQWDVCPTATLAVLQEWLNSRSALVGGGNKPLCMCEWAYHFREALLTVTKRAPRCKQGVCDCASWLGVPNNASSILCVWHSLGGFPLGHESTPSPAGVIGSKCCTILIRYCFSNRYNDLHSKLYSGIWLKLVICSTPSRRRDLSNLSLLASPAFKASILQKAATLVRYQVIPQLQPQNHGRSC